MTDNFEFRQGSLPLLVSMAHSGIKIPPSLVGSFTPEALALADTDWHIPHLYQFIVDMNASFIQAHYSRYVIDLNRAPDNQSLYPGQDETGLCPLTSFAGKKLYYSQKQPNQAEIKRRIQLYWQPYHHQLCAELTRLYDLYGYAILFDAHSIRSQIPRLFANQLPDLNLGTNHGNSCHPVMRKKVIEEMNQQNQYSYIVDGRFIGGYITRFYGSPKDSIHALQMELSQVGYMDEDSHQYLPNKANKLIYFLNVLIESLLNIAHNIK